MSPPAISGAYTEDWREVADAVKRDAVWRCVRCGAYNDYDTGHVLTVHHFDGDKANNERWNLMALCQRCHLSVQARVDPRVALMFAPSAWAMPYVAGWYATGRAVVPDTYRLREWIAVYEGQVGAWPLWAPREDQAKRGDA